MRDDGTTRYSPEVRAGSRSIAVVGRQPSEDRAVLAAAAETLGLDIVSVNGTDGEAREGLLLCGYISYLPCRASELLDFYACMPVGSAHDLPFFQCVDSDADTAELSSFPIFGFFRSPLTRFDACNMVRAMMGVESAVCRCRELVSEVARYRHEKNNLMRMGMALASENDVDRLLALILSLSREAVCADAGSIYVRQQSVTTGMLLDRIVFKVAQNDSVDVAEKTREEYPINIDSSTIAGHVAFTGQALNIADVYAIDTSVPYSWGRGFDRRFGYRTKSMLAVPLRNMIGEVVGVLQLMNKKRDESVRLVSSADVDMHVVPFERSDEELVLSIAPLAAVSIERVQLYKNIEDIFEGYVRSSAAAIDERDRVTAGHSRRVMGYALAVAEALDEEQTGPLAQAKLTRAKKRQLKFAALLHDIGKIGVPEALLTRECRLSPAALDAIRMRAEYVKVCLATGGERTRGWESAAAVDADVLLVEEANKAAFLSDEWLNRLAVMREKSYVDTAGASHPFITDSEWQLLSVRRGNLTDEERDIVNSHVQVTRRILSKIPWTPELREIPAIAGRHHEKMDGSGYPDKLRGHEICLESRILAIVDIYDALVAQDRPYKRAVEPTRAIAILRQEARDGRLDADLVELFVAKGIWRLFTEDFKEN